MVADIGGQRAHRHPGGAFGFSSDFLRFPELGLTVIALSKRADLDAMELGLELARLALGDRFEPPNGAQPAPLTPELTATLAGLWRDPHTQELWFVRPRSDRFLVITLGDLKLELAPVSDTRLEPVEPKTAFAIERVEEHLEIDRAGVRTSLESVPFPPATQPPIEEFLGDYASTTLPAGITLESRDGRLALHQDQTLLSLPPFVGMGQDTFICDAGVFLRFARDEHGAISGLVMDINRARGLEFTALE